MDVKVTLRRLDSQRTLRQPHEATMQECFDYTFPERGNGLNSSTFNPQELQTKKNRILDDTAADSSRILSAGLVSGTTPANSIWFGLDMGGAESENEESEEERWLDDSSVTIFENIHAANFDAAAYECCIDIVPAGHFVLYIDEAPDGGYQFEQWPIGECYISASRPGKLIDTIFRETEFTVEQLVNEYGIDKVSAATRGKYENDKFDEKVKICQAIYPRKLSVVGARMAKNLPFSSCHIEINDKHLLRESGYHEFPCVCPRWMLVPGTNYATGPVANALGSIRTINDIKALELANLDIAVGGMWIAEDDGVLNPKSIKLGARKVIIANSVDSMKELKSSGNFSVAFSAEERLQATIRKILLADQLQPQDGPAMTATEVHVRVQMIRQLLGPIYGRLQAEYLQPLIQRCFGIAYRAGVLGIAPQGLQGREFLVKYISPLARSQKMEEVLAIDQFIAGAVSIFQVHPDVMDTIDFDAAQSVKAAALGVPSSVRRPVKEIAALRDKRDKQAQAAQQQQQQHELMTKAAPAIAQQAVAA